MNRRIGRARTATKINGGKGITIRSEEVNFPTYNQRIKFQYDGKEGVLDIIHDYDSASGYIVTVRVEFDGKEFDEHAHQTQHGDDGWEDYVYSQFNGTFMSNRHQLDLPRPFVALIEKRVALLAGHETMEGREVK